MINRKTPLALAIVCLTASSAIHAEQTWFGNNVADGQWLAGIKLHSTEAGLPGYNEVNGIGLMVGYQFSRPVGEHGAASLELELGGSSDADVGTGSLVGNGAEWDYDSTAVFFNYRSGGNIYYKGKFGILDSNITTKFPSGASNEVNDTFFAYGVGAGIRLGTEKQRINLEAEWVGTAGESDINAISVGGVMEF